MQLKPLGIVNRGKLEVIVRRDGQKIVQKGSERSKDNTPIYKIDKTGTPGTFERSPQDVKTLTRKTGAKERLKDRALRQLFQVLAQTFLVTLSVGIFELLMADS